MKLKMQAVMVEAPQKSTQAMKFGEYKTYKNIGEQQLTTSNSIEENIC